MHANNSQLLLRHISCSDVTILQSSTQYLNQAEEDNIAFQLSYFPTSPPEVADAAPCESMFTRTNVVVSKVPLPSNKRGNMLPRAPAPPIPPIIIIRRRSLVSLRESFKIRGRDMLNPV